MKMMMQFLKCHNEINELKKKIKSVLYTKKRRNNNI